VQTKEGAGLVLLVNLVPPFLRLKEFAVVSLSRAIVGDV
jgi:hypothetical protein